MDTLTCNVISFHNDSYIRSYVNKEQQIHINLYTINKVKKKRKKKAFVAQSKTTKLQNHMQDAINVKEYKTKYKCDTNFHSVFQMLYKNINMKIKI